jgi:translation initiation factor IF-2
LAKRVFEIAKELGIASKVIVAKCHAEGIPQDVIKNHMSSVSVGLEATINEWFSGGEASTSAVETSEKVDLEKARAAAPKRTKAKAKAKAKAPAGDEADSTTATAVMDKPARAGAPAPAPEDEPTADETPTRAPEPVRPAASAPAAATPEAPEASEEAPSSATETAPSEAASAEKGAGDAKVTPAPMNVPTRPKVVKPAGRQLTEKAPVKLSGPKVVRVEAPEAVERPRGRRPGGGFADTGRGPRGGGGVVAPGPMPEDDRGRGGPRRGGGGDRGGDRRGGGSTRRRGRGGFEGGGGSWRQQDLIEREARLQRAGGYLKKRRQEAKRRGEHSTERAQTPAEAGGTVRIVEPFTIKDLSAATGVKAADIVKKLFLQGVMANINSGIDPEKAQEVMIDYDIELEVVEAKSAEDVVAEQFAEREGVDVRPRGPVVTILGHVDHGKTSLLDKIRSAKVAEGEAGGITQATSAFRVPVHVGDEEKQVVFIDTPGHEAFTEMRSRGATVTDIVVLVVAADDGVMPQTVESIAHAKAAGVPIVVALNKIDKPEATDANIQRILGQLAEHELNPTEWGGETEVVKTSAVKGEGIDELLEVLDYQAQLLELKADFDGPAQGTVIESRLVEGRGAVANILLQEGRLKVGDFIVAGRGFGRVRDISDDRGQKLKEALPPMPVQISGLDEVPDAGDKFFVTDSLKRAQEASEQRRERERETQLAQPKVTLDSLFSQMSESDVKEILIIVKADVQGSVDVLRNEIEKVSTDEVKVRVLHAAIGGITESDVLLADASSAVIIGFNVIPSGKARQVAEQKSVEIRTYQVIYDVTDDVRKAAEGMLEPELRQEILGHAEVRQVFKLSKVGAIAGCYVTDGTVQRDAFIRVTRDDIVIENDRVLEQLKRFKDDAKEVRAGMECGMKIAGYDDIKEGDVLECYRQVEIKRTL